MALQDEKFARLGERGAHCPSIHFYQLPTRPHRASRRPIYQVLLRVEHGLVMHRRNVVEEQYEGLSAACQPPAKGGVGDACSSADRPGYCRSRRRALVRHCMKPEMSLSPPSRVSQTIAVPDSSWPRCKCTLAVFFPLLPEHGSGLAVLRTARLG